MKYLLALLILLNIADATLSYFLVRLGLGREGNPFLLELVHQPGFIIIKVVGVLLCALILWDIYRRNSKLAIVSTSCFVSIYGVIVLWNLGLFLS